MPATIKVLPGADEIVVLQWSRRHGDCLHCGLPAAFYLPDTYGTPGEPPTDRNKRCAICAANAAADGTSVKRIEQED